MIATEIKLRFIQIAVTSTCNLMCKHCYQKDDKKKENMLPLNILIKIMNDAKSCNANKIYFTGGEFFTHPDHKEILKFANSLGFSIDIATNATIINDNDIILLRSIQNINTVIVSIDGFDEDHDWMRGIGSFNKTINTIKKLIHENINVGVTIAINSRNISYLDELSAYLGSIGVTKVNYLNIGAAGFALDNSQYLLPSMEHLKIIKNIYQKYGEINSSDRCNIFMKTLSINYDGTVYPCTMARSTHIFPLGSVYENSLIDIWNNVFIENRYPFINFRRADLEECLICTSFKECGGQCRIRAYKYYRDFLKPDPFACWVYKNFENTNIQNLMFGKGEKQ